MATRPGSRTARPDRSDSAIRLRCVGAVRHQAASLGSRNRGGDHSRRTRNLHPAHPRGPESEVELAGSGGHRRRGAPQQPSAPRRTARLGGRTWPASRNQEPQADPRTRRARVRIADGVPPANGARARWPSSPAGTNFHPRQLRPIRWAPRSLLRGPPARHRVRRWCPSRHPRRRQSPPKCPPAGWGPALAFHRRRRAWEPWLSRQSGSPATGQSRICRQSRV